MLRGKTVLLGVTGGIAAYKAAALASGLVKLGAAVETVMTRHATEFIAPLTFEQLTGRREQISVTGISRTRWNTSPWRTGRTWC